MYKYIINFELLLLMRYEISPATFLSGMTVVDLQIFAEQLSAKISEENAQKEKSKVGNKLMKSLLAIRDILNYLFPQKKADR